MYREVTGNLYPRKAAKAPEMNAGVLNNTALSFIDLGNPDTARTLFLKALELDPQHPDAVYNYGLFRWRRGLITDDEAIAEMKKVRDLNPSEEAAMHLARMEMERQEPEGALEALKKAGLAEGKEPAGQREQTEKTVPAETSEMTGTADQPERPEQPEQPGQPEQPEQLQTLLLEIDRIKKEHEARRPIAVKMRQKEIMSMTQDAVWVADKQNGVRLISMEGKPLRHFPQMKGIDAVSEDDRLIAVFEKTGTMRRSYSAAAEYCCSVYDAETGEKKCSVDNGLGDSGCELYFLDGGRILVIRGAMEYQSGYDENHDEDLYDKTTEEDIRVYDLESGKKLYALEWTFKRECFGAGGKWLADTMEIWENDRPVRKPLVLYDAYTGNRLKELEADTRRQRVERAFFPAGAAELFTLSRDGFLRVYSVPEGKLVRKKKVHDPELSSKELLACAGGRLVSGDRMNRFRFWNESGRCVRSGPNAKDLWNMAPDGLSPSGNYWCAEKDHMLYAWPFPENSPAAPWSLSRVQSTREILDAAGQFKLLMEQAREARNNWRFGEAYALCLQARELPGFENAREAIDLCLDCGIHGTRTTLRLVHRRAEFAPDTEFSEGTLFFGKGGRNLFYNLGGGVCSLFVARDDLVRTFHMRPGEDLIKNVALIPATGQLLCQTDRGAFVMRSGNGTIVKRLNRCLAAPDEKEIAGAGACAASPDGRYAAVLTVAEVGFFKKRRIDIIYLWDIGNDRKVCSWEPEVEPGALLFSREGDTLYAAGAKGVWALTWGGGTASMRKLPVDFSVGKYPLEMRMERSADGRYLLIHGYMGNEVIDLVEEKHAFTPGYGISMRDGALVPFSDLYFCACKDGVISLRDPSKGEVFRFREEGMPERDDETRIAVSPEGDLLAVATKNNGVALYDLEWNYEF